MITRYLDPCLGCMWAVVKIMVPLLGTLNIRCRIKTRTQQSTGTIILTTTHVEIAVTVVNIGTSISKAILGFTSFNIM